MYFLKRRPYPRFATIEKKVGETPLVALERFRVRMDIPEDVPLAYAGRLDPMASGKLLILIGTECKKQTKYHAFDKAYDVELLLGASSDSGDVLGIARAGMQTIVTDADARSVLDSLVGQIELPYPHFSSKAVNGKPLHLWTLEGRLGEITVPIKKSRIYRLSFGGLRTLPKHELLKVIRGKIESLPKVTDPRKALGEDFRRDAVREAWKSFEDEPGVMYQVLSFTCIASSGTYMRSLGEHIGKLLNTCALAYSIHRTAIGSYLPFGKSLGMWITKF